MTWRHWLGFCGLLLLGSLARSEDLYYIGTIGTQRALQVSLRVDGATVSGTAVEESVGVPWSLRGTLEANGAARLKEYAADGRTITGYFIGTFTANRQTFTGVEQGPHGGQSAPVTLTAVAVSRTKKVTARTATATATLPEFLHASPSLAALNTQFVREADRAIAAFLADAAKDADRARPWTFDRRQELAFYAPELVSLRVTTSYYTGGAHPNTVYSADNYLTNGAAAKRLMLGDLYSPRDTFYPVLYRAVREDLVRQRQARAGQTDLFWGATANDPLPDYTLSPTGITFLFSPYAVGPYVEGAYFATIPHRTMAAYIPPGSVLARFVGK